MNKNEYHVMKDTNKPLLGLLIRILTHQEDHEQYVGDIEELYYIHKERKGKSRANLYLLRQILYSIPFFVLSSIYWGVMMFKNYFKITFRNITRRKVHSLINVFGLAIGIACSIFILGYVQHELSYDRFLKNANNLYVVTFDNGSTSTPTALSEHLKAEYPEIVKSSRFNSMWHNYFTYKDVSSFQNGGAIVDPDFLSMFSINILQGNSKNPLESSNSILLSESVAKKYFGSENPVGKTLLYENYLDLQVSGVYEDYPENSHLRCDFIMPCSIMATWGRDLNTWDWNSITTYVQLNPEASLEKLNEKIIHLVGKYRENEKRAMFLQPVTNLRTNPNKDNGGTITYIYMFSVLAFLILLIACINFINLTTAKLSMRAKEVGIRKTIGAYKSQLAKQFFSESFILVILSFLLAIGFIALVLPLFNELTNKDFALNFIFKKNMILGVAGIVILTGFLSGSYPALLISRYQPAKVLKGFVNRKDKSTFRKILVVGQFVASISLILFSLVVFKQVKYLENRDVGFQKENIVYFKAGKEFKQNYERVKTQLLADKNVESMCLVDQAPYAWNTNAGLEDVHWQDQESNKIRLVTTSVNFDFLETFNIKMSEGRFFSREYLTDSINAYVVNECAIKEMGMIDPIGKWLKIWDQQGIIIGVVKDYHFESLTRAVRPMALKVTPSWFNEVCVRISSKNIPKTMKAIESTWKESFPKYPFQYYFLDETLRRNYEQQEAVGKLVSVFTVLAVFISCLGLFGLSLYTVEQRTKEIGIRKVLGASVFNIIKKLSKEFIILIVTAFIVALPLAYYAIVTWLDDFPYKTEVNLWLFFGTFSLIMLMTLFTISVQIIKAAITNPVKSLKYE